MAAAADSAEGFLASRRGRALAFACSFTICLLAAGALAITLLGRPHGPAVVTGSARAAGAKPEPRRTAPSPAGRWRRRRRRSTKPIYAGNALLADPALIENTAQGPLPRIADDGRKPMTVYAAARRRRQVQASPSWCRAWACQRQGHQGGAGGLPAGVTLGFAPYAGDVGHWVSAGARSAAMKCCWKCRWSRSIFPTAIRARTPCAPAQEEEANIQRLTWALSRFTGYAGVTNLLGQRFLSDSEALSPVLTYLARRGLYFFDNGAASQSVAPSVAGQVGIPAAQSGPALDSIQTALEIDRRLSDLEDAGARPWQRRGFGVSLSGHRRAHRRLGARAGSAGLCSGPGFGHSRAPTNRRGSFAPGTVMSRASGDAPKCPPICPTGPASASCCSTGTARSLSASASTRPWKAGRCRKAASTRARAAHRRRCASCKEEAGTDKAEIIAEMEDWVTYDLPRASGRRRVSRQIPRPAAEMVRPALHRARTATSISPPMSRNSPLEMGGPGGAAAPDRALQARHLQGGDRRLPASAHERQRRPAAKPPVVMIHGAFCGPWSLDGLQREIRGGRLRGHRALPAPSRRRNRRPPRWAPPAWPIMPPIWKTRSQALDDAPILVGHSMGGLAGADAGGAAWRSRALILLAPSAPWGVPPSTLFEIGAAQAHASAIPASGTWSWSPIAMSRWPIRWTSLPRHMRDEVFDRLVPESGRATFEIMHWGLDHATMPATWMPTRSTCAAAVPDRQRRPHQSALHGGAHRGALQRPRAPTRCCTA